MNKIEPMKPDELLQPNQWAEMESWFLAASFQSRADRYLLSFEVDEATWLHFKASVPKGSLVTQRFFYNDGDASDEAQELVEEKPNREKKTKPGTDDNGKYWQAMHHLDWWYAPGLCEVLGCEKTEADTAQALKVVLGVSSRREISPDDFEAWCEQNSIASGVTISRQARAKA